jgi:hypothetical protein
MRQHVKRLHSRWAALCLWPLLTTSAWANDFPTAERVLYVHECMRNNPGPHFEMVSKCSCALDKVASEVKFEDYESMATVTNAVSIGGERGGTLRDNEILKPQVKRWRELQAKARDACFIGVGPR